MPRLTLEGACHARPSEETPRIHRVPNHTPSYCATTPSPSRGAEGGQPRDLSILRTRARNYRGEFPPSLPQRMLTRRPIGISQHVTHITRINPAEVSGAQRSPCTREKIKLRAHARDRYQVPPRERLVTQILASLCQAEADNRRERSNWNELTYMKQMLIHL